MEMMPIGFSYARGFIETGDWGLYGLHFPGDIRAFEHWKGPKKMLVGPRIYLDRPQYQYDYESLRWFDYWLKGVDTGIMDEPPV